MIVVLITFSAISYLAIGIALLAVITAYLDEPGKLTATDGIAVLIWPVILAFVVAVGFVTGLAVLVDSLSKKGKK